MAAWKPKIRNALSVTAALAMLIALALIFFHAPVERTMGIAQKIFYFHVPAAMAAYAGFTVAAVAANRRMKTAAPASSTPPPSARQIDGAVLTTGTKNVPVAAWAADENPAR